MKTFTILAALLCGTQAASAAFIDHGTYLTDAASGLDWLDVTASVNWSYTDVSGQLAAGGSPLVQSRMPRCLHAQTWLRSAGQQVASLCEQVCVVPGFLDFEA